MGLTVKQREMKAAKAAQRAELAAQETTDAPVRGPTDTADMGDAHAHLGRMASIRCAADIAHYLSETELRPRLHLLRIVRLMGPALARDVLSEALRIERDGGELAQSGMHYRTTGGIFFRLARDLLTAEEWTVVTGQPTTGQPMTGQAGTEQVKTEERAP